MWRIAAILEVAYRRRPGDPDSDYTVASAGTAVLTINNSYDINGNLTTETETGSGVSVTYVNSYDGDNRITKEVRNGTTVTYGYNAESEVTSAGGIANLPTTICGRLSRCPRLNKREN